MKIQKKKFGKKKTVTAFWKLKMIAVQWWNKSDNGAKEIFFIYFPLPKGTWYISYHFLSDVHIRSIWWLSNENKRFTWYMFWADPISIQYLENAALKLVKKWTVVIVVFGSHRLMQEPWPNLSDDNLIIGYC